MVMLVMSVRGRYPQSYCCPNMPVLIREVPEQTYFCLSDFSPISPSLLLKAQEEYNCKKAELLDRDGTVEGCSYFAKR